MTTIVSNVITETILTGFKLTLASSALSAYAGSVVTFTATLSDNGAPVMNATIVLFDKTTGTSSTAVTDSSGHAAFSVMFSATGTYDVQASTVV